MNDGQAPNQTGPQGERPHDCRSWSKTIRQKTEQDTRSQPWKGSFGKTTGGLNDEDWIQYPAVCDMSKKGIKGWFIGVGNERTPSFSPWPKFSVVPVERYGDGNVSSCSCGFDQVRVGQCTFTDSLSFSLIDSGKPGQEAHLILYTHLTRMQLIINTQLPTYLYLLWDL